MKFFGMDHTEYNPDKIEFVYVVFIPHRPITYPDKGVYNPNFLGTYQWGAKGLGFGEVSMYRMSDREPGCDTIYFDTEHMSKKFLKQMLSYLVDQSITDRDNPNNETPEFERQHMPVGRQASQCPS